MIFSKTKFEGVFVIELEPIKDERGFFARSWDTKIFQEKNLNSAIVQCNISISNKKGTLRGMHYQTSPYAEVKIIRCTQGSLYDVIIDLRPNSKTFKKWFGIELNPENHKSLYVPEGFAHGHQTLKDETELFYQVSQVYMPKYEGGVRWNDPNFQIKWPIKDPTISEKDSSWKDFQMDKT